jgi:DUF4097 and DUF4098 domain-containing protein YvlB
VGPRHSGGNGNDVAVRFTVELPKGVKVDATTVNGDVNVIATAGVTATTVKGDITADAGGWPVKLVTVAGDVNATVRSVTADSASITSVSGDVTLLLPKVASLTVEGNTVSGDIVTGFPLTVTTPQYGPGHSVHGAIGAGAGRIAIHTVSGNISVEPIGASVRAGRRTPKATTPPPPAVAPQPR